MMLALRGAHRFWPEKKIVAKQLSKPSVKEGKPMSYTVLIDIPLSWSTCGKASVFQYNWRLMDMYPILILGPSGRSEDRPLVQQAQAQIASFGWTCPVSDSQSEQVLLFAWLSPLPDLQPLFRLERVLTSSITKPGRSLTSHRIGKEAQQRGHVQLKSNPSFPSQGCFHLATWYHLRKTSWPEGSSCIKITPLQKKIKICIWEPPTNNTYTSVLPGLPGPIFLTSLCSQSRQPKVGTQVCGRITRLPPNNSCMGEKGSGKSIFKKLALGFCP